MPDKHFSKLFLSLTIITLVLLATHPAWSYHLRVDADGFYLSRARYFLVNHNLTGLGYNEYQPGAVLFFLALSPLLLWQNSNNLYLAGLFAANILFIIALAGLYRKFSGNNLSILVFALILLFMGPIVLYRFDLYVVFFTLLSLWFLVKRKAGRAFFLLGIATSIKIYPALLLPYYLLPAVKSRHIKTAAVQTAIFLMGAAAVILLYLLFFQVPPADLITNADVHALKPVHAESLWGTILTLIPWLTTGTYALGKGATGIFGIAPQYTPGPLFFYNFFWLVPLGLYYFWLIFKAPRQISPLLPAITIILLFLTFSKILTAQYLLWAFLLFPALTPPTESGNNRETRLWSLGFFLILFISLLSQYIYPLRYNELLGVFYTSGNDAWVFWLLALRNCLLLVLFIFLTELTLWLKS